ncbi:MAG: AtpZ/AtpI family protein [Acidobacteria bacterium]|nr:AtpZ/AtpI family protein [Acidobacteriota bacterium]
MQPEEKGPSPWRQLGLVMTIAFVFPAGLVVGGAGGWWLDNKLGTFPLFALLGLGAGFAAALLELFRELKRLNRK